MSMPFFWRGLSTGIFALGLLCGVTLLPGAAGADAASAHDLRALAARDGRVLVRVELASGRAAQGSADITVSAGKSAAQDATVDDLLFGLPEGSYADVERQEDGATLIIQVDSAALDALSVSAEVVGITPATMPTAMPDAMRRLAAGGAGTRSP